MTRSVFRFVLTATVYIVLGACSLTAMSQSLYQVNLDTHGIEGMSGGIVFDFIAGDTVTPNNTAVISAFATDAVLLGANNTNLGDASGNLPDDLTLLDSGFSESFRGATMGNSISYLLSITGSAVSPGVDELSFFLTDATNTGSLVSTSDPTGSDALFVLDIDGSRQGRLTLYSISTPNVSYSVSLISAGVAEPSSFCIAASGIGFVGLFRWRNRRRLKQS